VNVVLQDDAAQKAKVGSRGTAVLGRRLRAAMAAEEKYGSRCLSRRTDILCIGLATCILD
jgi:hypothetical protein